MSKTGSSRAYLGRRSFCPPGIFSWKTAAEGWRRGREPLPVKELDQPCPPVQFSFRHSISYASYVEAENHPGWRGEAAVPKGKVQQPSNAVVCAQATACGSESSWCPSKHAPGGKQLMVLGQMTSSLLPPFPPPHQQSTCKQAAEFDKCTKKGPRLWR